jgi:hypothetical protein
MEIVLERIAKKNTYTIGRLYLLADGDVIRKSLSGKRVGDKRSFRHSFDMQKLSDDTYFCDTMEPTWRNLKGVDLKPQEVNAKYSRAIDVYLLYHKPFRTFTPILVGTLAVAFILPFSFTFTLLGVTSSDIRHDSVDRLGNRLLSTSCRCAED